MATAATIQDQEANRRAARIERALDNARERRDRLAGQLANARKHKKTLRIVELEPELAEATEAFNKAALDYEHAFGIPVPPSQSHAKPGTVLAVRAANPEFRSVDDTVARCENEINRLRPEIARREKAVAALGPVPASTAIENPGAEALLDEIYPYRREVRASNVASFQRAVQSNVQLQTELFELKVKLDNVTSEWNVARTKRDAMLAELRGAQ